MEYIAKESLTQDAVTLHYVSQKVKGLIMSTSFSNGGNAEQGASYYSQQNKKENYYQKNNEIGYLSGKGIERIGLKQGQVLDQSTFTKLMQGINPVTKKPLVRNHGAGRERAFFDVTNSPPKSLSILIAQLESRGELETAKFLRDLHEKANHKSIELIQDNFTRTRIGTEAKEIKTDGLMWAKFQHDTAREVDGFVDPQLHTHNVIFNQVAYHDEDGKVKSAALHNDQIYKNKAIIQLHYHTTLANSLKEHGIDIELTNLKRGEFEIKEFSREQVLEFSSRRKIIEENLPKYKEKYPNKTEDELKDLIVKKTKKAKQEIDMSELLKVNRARMNDIGVTDDFIDNVVLKNFQSGSSGGSEKVNAKVLEKHIRTALENIVEKESTFLKEEVLVQALQKSALEGFNITLDEYSTVFDEMKLRSNRLDELELMEIGESKSGAIYTVKKVIEAEHYIINKTVTDDNRKKESYVQNKKELSDYLDDKYPTLTKGQREMVETALLTDNRYLCVQGDAGTGKTFAVKALKETIKEKFPDMEIVGLSYTGMAVKGLSEDGGIDSYTLHQFLGKEEKADTKKKPRLLIVDEAGMAGSLQMAELIKVAEQNGDTLLLIGDTKQFKSIGAGQIFDDLQKYGAQTVHMKETKRQKTDYTKSLVSAIKEKDTEKIFSVLEEHNKIIENENLQDLVGDMIVEYKKSKNEGTAPQLLASKNTDRKVLNNIVRGIEKEEGNISEIDRPLPVYENVNLQDVEAEHNKNYEANYILTINEPINGFRYGDKAIVEGADIHSESVIYVRREKDGRRMSIDLSKNNNFRKLSIFKKVVKDFSVGDKIVYTKNNKGLKIKNGMADTIVEVDEMGNIFTEKGKDFNVSDYPFVDYRYCLTDYKSQGMTTERALILADHKMANFNSQYVQATRVKNDVQFFTQNKEALKRKITQEQVKGTTLDYADIEKILHKGKGNGRNIDRGNEKITPRANEETGGSKKNRDGQLSNNPRAKERERTNDKPAQVSIGVLERRKLRRKSNERAFRRAIESDSEFVPEINRLIDKIDQKIAQLDHTHVPRIKKDQQKELGKMKVSISVTNSKEVQALKGWNEKETKSYTKLSEIMKAGSYSVAKFSGDRKSENIVGYNNLVIFDVDNDKYDKPLTKEEAKKLLEEKGISGIIMPSRNDGKAKKVSPRHQSKHGKKVQDESHVAERYHIVIPMKEAISKDIDIDTYREFQFLTAKSLGLENYADRNAMNDRARFYYPSLKDAKPLVAKANKVLNPSNIEQIASSNVKAREEQRKEAQREIEAQRAAQREERKVSRTMSTGGIRYLTYIDVDKIIDTPIEKIISKFENIQREYKEGNYNYIKTGTAKYSVMQNDLVAYDFKSGKAYNTLSYLHEKMGNKNLNKIALTLENLTGNTYIKIDIETVKDAVISALQTAKNDKALEQSLCKAFSVNHVKLKGENLRIAGREIPLKDLGLEKIDVINNFRENRAQEKSTQPALQL
jgi:conjugative relaxase-like TrwC/TraI family protein